jgi:SAM-dependent methyltransferase
MENHFGHAVAAAYDDPRDPMFDPALLERTTAFLADLAGDGPALELAIGTGRVALPLTQRGVAVSGIEFSDAMIEQLRAKPGGDAIAVTNGDMATTRVDGEFALVYLVYNSLPNLVSQDQQVDCFINAAGHLRPGGHFVIEINVPVARRIPPGESLRVFHHGDDHLGIDEVDPIGQRSWSHHYTFGENGAGSVRRNSVPFRYVWPSELDLMGRIAGLELVGRWADWDRNPFTADSPAHVSVWRRPED